MWKQLIVEFAIKKEYLCLSDRFQFNSYFIDFCCYVTYLCIILPSFPLHSSLCTPVCVFMHICKYVFVHTCMCLRWMLGIILYCSPTLFIEAKSLSQMQSADMACITIQFILGIPFLHFQRLVL